LATPTSALTLAEEATCTILALKFPELSRSLKLVYSLFFFFLSFVFFYIFFFNLWFVGVEGDPDFMEVQADQQICIASNPGIYCNKRGIIKTQGHVIEVSGNMVTIDGAVTPISGTHPVGNGVNVTKKGNDNYVVSFPNGTAQFMAGTSYAMNIYITIDSGREPTGNTSLCFWIFFFITSFSGGLCTQYLGLNPTTKRAVTPYAFCVSCIFPPLFF
jgi:hypothetical protein